MVRDPPCSLAPAWLFEGSAQSPDLGLHCREEMAVRLQQSLLGHGNKVPNNKGEDQREFITIGDTKWRYFTVTLAATSKRVKTPRGRLRRVFTLSGLFYGSAR